MFDEIRYELNDAEIDHNRNVGITTLKSYASFSSDNIMILHNAGFIPSEYAKSLMTQDVSTFAAQHVVGLLRGLRVIINARHELILIRACNDNNCVVGDPASEPKLELFKIQW